MYTVQIQGNREGHAFFFFFNNFSWAIISVFRKPFVIRKELMENFHATITNKHIEHKMK